MMAARKLAVFGDEHTAIALGAATNAAWVSPGGNTCTRVAVADDEHGWIPGSETKTDE